MYYLYLRTLLVMAQIATLLPSILKIQSPFRCCKTGLRAICGSLQSFIKLEINFKTKLVTAQIIVKLNCGVMRRAGPTQNRDTPDIQMAFKREPENKENDADGLFIWWLHFIG